MDIALRSVGEADDADFEFMVRVVAAMMAWLLTKDADFREAYRFEVLSAARGRFSIKISVPSPPHRFRERSLTRTEWDRAIQHGSPGESYRIEHFFKAIMEGFE